MTTNEQFKTIIWDYYHAHKRKFPWRRTTNPYKIVVSEIMLQQTQTNRVIPKYETFVKVFPDFQKLAQAPVADVIKIWQGLGYNRRALNLKRTAEIIMEYHQGQLPTDPLILQTFPGIGKATAASIIVFSYNLPIPFIETNIRRVFIHFFFSDKNKIDDKEILPLVEQTIDQKNPREWFYALMDYGNMLGKEVENANVKSKHYIKQSTFEGSKRQLRGKILRYLTYHQKLNEKFFQQLEERDRHRVEQVLFELASEGFIQQDKKGNWQMTVQ